MKIKNPFKKKNILYPEDVDYQLHINFNSIPTKPGQIARVAVDPNDNSFVYLKFHWCSAQEVALAKLKGEEVVE